MDESRMSVLSISTLTGWAAILALTIHFVAGIAVGMLYFRGLWSNVRRLTADESLITTIGLMIGRFLMLGALLTLASLEGALPLLMIALGVLIGRAIFMRNARESAP